MDPTSSIAPADRACIHLLDSARGTIIQSWQFDTKRTISIGRSPERDIRVGDQQVSRLHAELMFVDDGWILESRGRNGLLIDGKRVERAMLGEDTIFRLGPDGPMLSFRHERVVSDSLATIDSQLPLVLQLRIDDQRKAQEVEEIAGGDYFKHLSARAQKLKRQK